MRGTNKDVHKLMSRKVYRMACGTTAWYPRHSFIWKHVTCKKCLAARPLIEALRQRRNSGTEQMNTEES